MFKFLKRLFKRKPKYVVPDWEPYYERKYTNLNSVKSYT
jgi:hypothetical protein